MYQDYLIKKQINIITWYISVSMKLRKKIVKKENYYYMK